MQMQSTELADLIARYKSDPESVYNTWFVSGEERLKTFRAIRRGVRDTVDAIAAGTFGNDFGNVAKITSRCESSSSTFR